jgi:hypothetical protein
VIHKADLTSRVEMGFNQAPVTQVCNYSYSGGRDQEDGGLKPAPEQIVCETLSQKYPTHVRPEFKPQYHQKKINK